MFEILVEMVSRLDDDVANGSAWSDGSGASARSAGAALSDAVRVDQLSALERVKAACAALQARITVDFAESQEQAAVAWRARARECADGSDFDGWVAAREAARRATVQVLEAGLPSGANSRSGSARSSRSSRRPGAEFGVAGQVALARRESPTRGSRHLALAVALVRNLPHTLAALKVGAVSEWRAEIIVRETSILTPEQQTAVDSELFDGPDQLGADGIGMLGDRELARRVRAIAYRIDAQSVVDRARGAQADRRVTIRPAPDTMCYLTAYLPVAQGVAVHAALTVAAATARAAGDERGKGQVMADTLVERVTGQASAEAVPVEVQVVITDRALFTGALGSGPIDQAPAQIPGYGTVPAAFARDLIRPVDPGVPSRDDVTAATVWLRRLYTHPDDGTLMAMESTRRTFTGGLRRLLIARDGTCTTPWCDAPIAHLDHVVPHADGGPTTAHNGRGLCARCNYTQQHPGWRARPETAPPHRWRRHTIVTTTPTGHRYASNAPPVLPGATRAKERSLLERHLETIFGAA